MEPRPCVECEEGRRRVSGPYTRPFLGVGKAVERQRLAAAKRLEGTGARPGGGCGGTHDRSRTGPPAPFRAQACQGPVREAESAPHKLRVLPRRSRSGTASSHWGRGFRTTNFPPKNFCSKNFSPTKETFCWEKFLLIFFCWNKFFLVEKILC